MEPVDGVAKRHNWTAATLFAAIRSGVERDVEIRNRQLHGTGASRFQAGGTGDTFNVIRMDPKGTRGVQFTREGDVVRALPIEAR